MATYLHPGVYIEEFAPGSPIQGVGTSTAAFIGVAADGPIREPRRLTSLEELRDTFGDPLEETYADGQKPWLWRAVRGFFENGGTACWVVREASAANATNDLDARAGAPPPPVIVVRAATEGAAGNGITVAVADRSLLEDALGGPLLAHRASTAVSAHTDQRRRLTVASNAGFQQGDTVTLAKAPLAARNAVVDGVAGTDTLVLTAPLPGPDNYAGGTVRLANLAPGTAHIRVTVPAGTQLRRVLPAGSTVAIGAGAALQHRVVSEVGADTLTLRDPLAIEQPMTADVEITSLEFDLHVVDPATGRVEDFPGRAMDPAHPAWFGSVQSAIATFHAPDAATPPTGDPRPATGTVTLAGGLDDNRATSWAALALDAADVLATLDPIDEVAIVAIPGATGQNVQQQIVGHCERTRDRIAVLDAPRGADPTAAIAHAATVAGDQLGFAALYYPWIQVFNATTSSTELFPPSAHIAGIYARTDATRGVFKAPANTTVRGALGLERRLTDRHQDALNPNGVNALRIPPNGGAPQVWGARTTTMTDRNWQYVNIRRLFLYLEESIAEGIRWAVFEPNDRRLWKKLEQSISAFLTQAWRDGALFGDKPGEAYYVRIDDALNPPSERKLGRLYIEIGVQPVYPAEFVVVRIGIWDGGSSVAEA